MTDNNLPPGVNDAMIPGNEIALPVWALVPEDFVELGVEDWAEWDVGEGEAECDECKAMIGVFLTGGDPWEPEQEAWAACWLVNEKILCEDCKTELEDAAAKAQDEMPAADD